MKKKKQNYFRIDHLGKAIDEEDEKTSNNMNPQPEGQNKNLAKHKAPSQNNSSSNKDQLPLDQPIPKTPSEKQQQP